MVKNEEQTLKASFQQLQFHIETLPLFFEDVTWAHFKIQSQSSPVQEMMRYYYHFQHDKIYQ